MKSLVIILFFIIIVYLNYKYSYKKYYTDNIETKIKYIILPIYVNDYFKQSNLKHDFKYMFDNKKIDKNYTFNEPHKHNENNENNENNTFSLQRFFTEF